MTCDIKNNPFQINVEVEKAWSVDSSVWSDRTTAFNAAATDVQLFAADNDVVYIGSPVPFQSVGWDLATGGSANFTGTFEYYKYKAEWTEFTPSSDTTTGLQTSGLMSWSELPNWKPTRVNSETTGEKAGWYYVRMTRTQDTLVTPPTENKVTIKSRSLAQAPINVKRLVWSEPVTAADNLTVTDQYDNQILDYNCDTSVGTGKTYEDITDILSDGLKLSRMDSGTLWVYFE